MISTTVSGAIGCGLDISTLPPHLSIMTGEDLFYDNKVMLGFSLPEILQDVNQDFWSFIAHQKMHEEENSIGFVFWCLIEDSSGEQSVFGMSYFKGDGFKGFLSDPEFQSEPSLLTDPHQIVPSFLGYDFEVDCVVH